MRKLLCGAALCLLAGCSALQLQQAQTYQQLIAQACQTALPLAAGMPGIGTYVAAACATEQAIAKLALDPSSLEWLNALIAQAR